MKKDDAQYKSYLKVLREELVPAMGCTEPISIAYAAAKAMELVGKLPEQCRIEVSGNIIKNVKSVVVPNTNGLKGIEASVAAGIIAGDASKKLEVLSNITKEMKPKIREYLLSHPIAVVPADNDMIFYIDIILQNGDQWSEVIIEGYHTNITQMKLNGKVLFQAERTENPDNNFSNQGLLNIKDIVKFANIADIEDFREPIGRQIAYNSTISEEGLKHNWGANVGKTILKTYGTNIAMRAKAAAAAGSDARMGGCEKPVIIVSGSGNQGITAVLPVIEYAKELNVSEDKLYRAVALSDLVTIYQKTGIGRLSAFCGAVCAGCGSGAGIAYLHGGGYKEIAHTIVNALAIVSGIVCDGAKPSCAAKIAASVDAGILGYEMYKNGQQFRSGDGIVTKGVDNTISNVGRMAREGMKSTDKEILKIMTGH